MNIRDKRDMSLECLHVLREGQKGHPPIGVSRLSPGDGALEKGIVKSFAATRNPSSSMRGMPRWMAEARCVPGVKCAGTGECGSAACPTIRQARS